MRTDAEIKKFLRGFFRRNYKAQGHTQKSLGEAAGLTKGYVNTWLNDKADPDMGVTGVFKMMELCGVDLIEYIKKREDAAKSMSAGLKAFLARPLAQKRTTRQEQEALIAIDQCGSFAKSTADQVENLWARILAGAHHDGEECD